MTDEHPEIGEIARLAALRAAVERDIVFKVRDAVEAGHTWTEVAAALGVSRQSAHERYAPRILDLARDLTDTEPAPDLPHTGPGDPLAPVPWITEVPGVEFGAVWQSSAREDKADDR